MNEIDGCGISVLLPKASVALYTTDPECAASMRGLSADWRFARVKIVVETGDVDTAIGVFQTRESPDLVIVQTDTIDEGLAGRLEALAGYCREDTAAIVIGPVNDVSLYRQLIGMGVSDYLVRPVRTEVLASVIVKTLLERIGAKDSTLIAVAGGKGGVGTSAVAQCLAWGAADFLHQKTLLMDAAGGWSSAPVSLGFEPSTTMAEAMRAADKGDEDSLGRMIFKASERLNVLATGGDVMLDHTMIPDQLEQLLDVMMAKFPLVLFDLSQAFPIARRIVFSRAQAIVVVSTPTLPSLRLTRALMGEIRELRGGKDEGLSYVVNMAGFSPAGEVARSDIDLAMERKPFTVIRYNPKLFMGQESRSEKISDDKVGAEIVRDLLPIVSRVTGDSPGRNETPPDQSSGGLGGLIGKFTKTGKQDKKKA